MGTHRAADGYKLVWPPVGIQLCDDVRLLVALLRHGPDQIDHHRRDAEELRCAGVQNTDGGVFGWRSAGDHQMGGGRWWCAAGRRAYRCLWHRITSEPDRTAFWF